MADLWGSLIGAAGSIYQANQASKAADKAQENAVTNSPNTTQQASMWQNQQNMGNQTWAQKQNQAAMNQAGLGSTTGAFGSASRTQDPTTGAWNVNSTLNAGDQATLDALRSGQTTGAGNLDMTGGYNVNSDYAKNYDALNRPAMERNQQAQRDRAAAMGMGWGSGKGNETLQGQLNDEQTRFGMATQNAGHDAWLADQANLRSNMATGQQGMQGIFGRQAQAPEWAPYATVNAPQSALVNKGNINSSLGWGAGAGGGAGGAGGGYAGWGGGSLTGGAGGMGGGAGGAENAINRSWTDQSSPYDVTYDENGNKRSIGEAINNGINDVSGIWNNYTTGIDEATGGWGGSILNAVTPGVGIATGIGAANKYLNPINRSSSQPSYGYSNPASSYGSWGTSSDSSSSGE